MMAIGPYIIVQGAVKAWIKALVLCCDMQFIVKLPGTLCQITTSSLLLKNKNSTENVAKHPMHFRLMCPFSRI
jgi:hypothetical protein